MPKKKTPKIHISEAERAQMKSTKIIRQYGVTDLEKYKAKIKQNIQVFEEAIKKEKTEMERVEAMIQALEKDIQTIETIEHI